MKRLKNKRGDAVTLAIITVAFAGGLLIRSSVKGYCDNPVPKAQRINVEMIDGQPTSWVDTLNNRLGTRATATPGDGAALIADHFRGSGAQYASRQFKSRKYWERATKIGLR